MLPFISEHTYTAHQYTPTIPKHHTPDEELHITTTEEEINRVQEYEDRRENEIDTHTPTYESESEQDRIPGRVHPDYNGYEHEITTKWYHPKTTDNRVVPPESEFFATIVGELPFEIFYLHAYIHSVILQDKES